MYYEATMCRATARLVQLDDWHMLASSHSSLPYSTQLVSSLRPADISSCCSGTLTHMFTTLQKYNCLASVADVAQLVSTVQLCLFSTSPCTVCSACIYYMHAHIHNVISASLFRASPCRITAATLCRLIHCYVLKNAVMSTATL